MKQNPRLLLFLLPVLFMFNSCKEPKNTGSVQFNLDQIGSELKSLLDSSYTDIPAAVYISVIDENDEYVLNMKRLPLVKMGNAYLTEHVVLPVGNYTVEDFLVVSGDDTVLYLTPKVDSEFAEYVNRPLPLAFRIKTEEIQYVLLEVIPANWGDPADYGYAVFTFKIVNPASPTCRLRYSDLYAEYRLNGDACCANDSSLNGTLFGAVPTTDREGYSNGAMYFDGINDYIKLPESFLINSDSSFSIEAWILKDSITVGKYAADAIFGQSDGRYGSDYPTIIFTVVSDFTLRGFVRGYDNPGVNVYSEEYAVSLNEWDHVVMVRNAEYKFVSLYINGVLQKTEFGEIEGNTLSNDFASLGAVFDDCIGMFQFFHGSMDMVRFWSVPLRPGQVAALYRGNCYLY